jgi:hypothetical protein
MSPLVRPEEEIDRLRMTVGVGQIPAEVVGNEELIDKQPPVSKQHWPVPDRCRGNKDEGTQRLTIQAV